MRSPMTSPLRYALVAFFLIVGLHYTLSFTHESYGQATSLASVMDTIHDKFYNQTRNANGVFVVVTRNEEQRSILDSIQQIEDRFNQKYGYPYVFLSDKPFSKEFIKSTKAIASNRVEYGLISTQHWNQPAWIDEDRASKVREDMAKAGIHQGDSLRFRNLARYHAGFFYRHPLLEKYQYYWRVDTDAQLPCDITQDLFQIMQDEGKVLGFTLSTLETPETVATLWDKIKEFITKHPEYINNENLMAFLSDDDGVTYNLCNFGGSFEIGSLNFWRSEAYRSFFQWVDDSGGFYYERWADTPIHSIAASLFARKDQLHFFDQVGYKHASIQHCPQGELHVKAKCTCIEKDNFDQMQASCLPRFFRSGGGL